MPSNTLFGSITIAASKEYLKQLFGQIDHPAVKAVSEAKENFVFETGVTGDLVHTASEMLLRTVPESMKSHYYKLKCGELLCLVFALLMQQEAMPAGTMHIRDVKAINAVMGYLHANLDKPPHSRPAREAGMSGPKLRKLFKQTFGKGIFAYYQAARMQKAARLLKDKRLSVTEAGYRLGFTNLSHFTRVFEQYMGVKPKRFSVGGGG